MCNKTFLKQIIIVLCKYSEARLRKYLLPKLGMRLLLKIVVIKICEGTLDLNKLIDRNE